ncbi:MAG: hypothetical protein ACRCX2_01145 [Paraclostridium sp.]
MELQKNTLKTKTRFIAIFGDDSIDLKHYTSSNVENVLHYNFRLIMIYVCFSLFYDVLDWHVFYSINTTHLVHINRKTCCSLITDGKFQYSTWDWVCKIFGRQNMLDLLIMISTRYRNNNNINNMIKFTSERIVFEETFNSRIEYNSYGCE